MVRNIKIFYEEWVDFARRPNISITILKNGIRYSAEYCYDDSTIGKWRLDWSNCMKFVGIKLATSNKIWPSMLTDKEITAIKLGILDPRYE